MKVAVIGGGLAGVECAKALSRNGFKVDLYEMKPHKKSPAHHSDTFAELVSSNSLRSNDVTSIKQVELGNCTVRSILSQYRPVLRKHCIMSNNNITIFFSLIRMEYH